MADLIGEALAQAETVTAAACRDALREGALSGEAPAPKAVWGGSFADCSTAFPLSAARLWGKTPPETAALLSAHMALEGTFLASAEAAEPGYLNFRLSPLWYEAVLEAAETAPPRQAAVPPLPDREAIRLLLGSKPGTPLEAELPLRRDRGNPLYRLRYAVQRLRRLPEPAEAVKDIPFSPTERALIKAIAACPPSLRRAEAEGSSRPAARSLLSLTDALRSYHTASRLLGTTPHPRPLRAALQTLETGMQALGIAVK